MTTKDKELIDQILAHLQNCLNFKNLKYDTKKLNIVCSCGESWDSFYITNDIQNFIENANMLPHVISDNARKNNTPIEHIIYPILGLLVEDFKFEDNKLEEPDVELF